MSLRSPSGAEAVAAPPDERRHADWDVAAAPRNYAALVAAQVVSSLLAFAAMWMVTREVGKTGYGALAAALAAGRCLGQLAIQWSAPSLVRFGCEEFVSTGRVAASFWARLKILAVAFALVTVTTPFWFPPLARVLHLDASMRFYVLAFVITTGFWVHVQYALQSAKLLQRQSRLLMWERVATVAGLVALWIAGALTVAGAVAVYVVTPLVAAIGGLWTLRALLVRGSGDATSPMAAMLQFSWPFVPATIIGYMSTNYFDAFFISYFRSTADLGQYTVIFHIAGMAMQLPLLAGSVALPLFITLTVTGGETRLARYFDDVLPIATLGWSALCALGAAVIDVLVPVVFGPEFANSGGLVWPLMCVAAFSGPIQMAYAPLASARTKPRVVAITAFAAGLTNTALNLLWIPRWGLVGCAWATTASWFVSLLLWMALVDERPVRHRLQVAEACLPVAFGAAAAALGGSRLVATSLALAVAVVAALWRRNQIDRGLAVLRSRA